MTGKALHLTEFVWYNPAKLPSPIEWVNKKKIPSKGFGKHGLVAVQDREIPKPTSGMCWPRTASRMKKLIEDPRQILLARKIGHRVMTSVVDSERIMEGHIPSNLLQYPNTESNSLYIRICKTLNLTPHPATFSAISTRNSLSSSSLTRMT